MYVTELPETVMSDGNQRAMSHDKQNLSVHDIPSDTPPHCTTNSDTKCS